MDVKNRKEQGFTIIEVVLVLAIAGLIFLMVFIALPALQRGQRDTQRKNDLSRVVSQVASYQSNNKGGVPVADATAFPAFVASYLSVNGDTFQDPNGSAYTYSYGASATAPVFNTTTKVSEVRYATSARCGANGVVTGGGAANQIAVSIGLEGGGAYCQQN